MKLKLLFSTSFALIAGLHSVSFAKEKAQAEESKQEIDMPKVSEAFGHLIAKNIESLGLNFDTERVIIGIQNSFNGKESPMSENECIAAITQVQEESMQKLATENLAKAEEFLEKNSLNKEVKEIEKGKLQYKIEKEGNGEIVKDDYSPTIRYKGTFLDNTVFGASKEDEVISLKDTIPGFAKGIAGMKEGEKRTLFVHPDLAYGTNGALPPNSMLKFEVEVVKANTAQEELTAQNEKDIAQAEAMETQE